MNADSLVALTGEPLPGPGGGDISISASFDVTDGNAQEIYAALHGMELVPSTTDTAAPAAPPNPTWIANPAAVPWIVQQSITNGSVVAQEQSRSSAGTAATVGGSVAEFGSLGLDLNATVDEVVSKNSWYLGDQGWHQWKECG